MTTKKLIAILERELGTVESNNVVDKARCEIIRRLKEHDKLKGDNKITIEWEEEITYR